MTVAEVDTVWWPEAPFADESMLGFCVRTMSENLLPHLPAFLAQAGQKHRNRHVDIVRGDADADLLATVLGVSSETIRPLRAEIVPDGVLYRGVVMAAPDVCTTIRRFGPETLKREAVHRADWCLRTLPYCTRSLEVLRSHCVCGQVQRWTTTRAPEQCQECGSSLADTPSIPTSDEDAAPLRAYADLVSGPGAARSAATAGLPDELRALAPGDLMELVLALVPIVEPRLRNARSAHCWLDGAGVFAAAIAQAWRLLPDWPSCLTDRACDTVDPRTAATRAPALLRLGRLLCSERPARTMAASKVILDQATAMEMSDAGRSVDFHEGERILRINAQELREARRRGEIGTVFSLRRGELLPMLNRAEVEMLACTDAVGAATVGRSLGLPRYGIEQLASAGLFDAADHPMQLRRYGLRVDWQSVADLLQRIENAAVATLEDCLTLRSALGVIGGREKPYLGVFRALLDGTLPFVIEKSDRSLTRRIHVDRTSLPMIASIQEAGGRYYDHYVLDDARNVLNLHVRDGGALAIHRSGRKRSAETFERDVVLDLARRHVGAAELSLRFGLHHAAVAAELRRSGLASSPFGWSRTHAEEFLGA